jgi:hypothetical protein
VVKKSSLVYRSRQTSHTTIPKLNYTKPLFVSGPPVVKIGEEVVAHGDWLSKVKKTKFRIFLCIHIYYQFISSQQLAEVKKNELHFFFIHFYYEFISAQRLYFFLLVCFQELIDVN